MTSNGGIGTICCDPAYVIGDHTIVKLVRKFPLPVIRNVFLAKIT